MLNSLQSWFSRRQFPIDTIKKPWVLATLGAVLSLLIVAVLWRGQSHYVPLYGVHQKVPADAVASALASEHIDFRINPDNGQILVADDLLARARMVLAGKNIQPVVAPGFELMDKDEILGASQYIQNIRYQRGLEGELARSIMSIEGVEEARVHLGIQAESGFVLSSQPPSSASVVLTLSAGIRLTAAQVRAITQLVAGSVPGLLAANVHVVDQTGALLNEAGNDQAVSDDLLQAVARPVTRNLTQLLDSAVGHDNYRVTVMPALDLRKSEETDEVIQGEPRVLEEQVNNDSSALSTASGVPGTLSNRPPAESKPDDNSKTNQMHSQTQRKYAYDRQIRHIKYPDQQLARLQVAVALNAAAGNIAGMSEAQLGQLKSLLENAAGIDSARGDTLSLDKLSFVAPPAVSVPVIAWWQQPDIQFWVTRGGIGLLALLMIVLVIRPRVIARNRQLQASSDGTAPAAGEINDSASASGHQFENEAELPPRASGIEDKVAYLQQLAENETDRIAEVIKQWINSNDRSRDNV